VLIIFRLFSDLMKKANKWRDHYTRRAREEKWLARSVYKLEEIDRKYRLLRPGNRVIDLGCSPGSWSQYCVKQVKGTGEVIGIDRNEPGHFPAPNFKYIQADILTMEPEWLAGQTGEVDLVISDLAPSTTGIKITDTSRSMDLAKKAYMVAIALLKKRGHFLCKIFEGAGLKKFKKDFYIHFEETHLIRPSAVRKRSKEIYLLGYKYVIRR
jgi:23S rRNA (uridine2552-2'-O)-methyltransferase